MARVSCRGQSRYGYFNPAVSNGVRREAEAGAFQTVERRTSYLQMLLLDVTCQDSPSAEVGLANKTSWFSGGF